MSDLTFTGGDILEQVHWKLLTVTVPQMAYVSAWVEVKVDETAATDGLNPFEGPPTAEARIIQVGNHAMGASIHGTRWRYFNTCPTAWQGFPDGNREIQVRLRTHFSVATVTVHVLFHSLLYDTDQGRRAAPGAPHRAMSSLGCAVNAASRNHHSGRARSCCEPLPKLTPLREG